MSSSLFPIVYRNTIQSLNKLSTVFLLSVKKQNQKHKKAKEFWQLYYVYHFLSCAVTTTAVPQSPHRTILTFVALLKDLGRLTFSKESCDVLCPIPS